MRDVVNTQVPTEDTGVKGKLSPVSAWTDIITYPDERDEIVSGNTMPRMAVVDTAGLPDHLRDAPCWLHWKWHLGKAGKWTKTPCNEVGRIVDAVDRTQWHTLGYLEQRRQTRLAKIAESGSGVDALGFAFGFDAGQLIGNRVASEHIHWGLDVDNCARGGKLLPGAVRLVQALGSYAEVSPTGTGIKIFFSGRCPLSVSQIALHAPGDANTIIRGTIDVKRRGFFTVTGFRVPASPFTVATPSLDVLRDLFGKKAVDPEFALGEKIDLSRGGRHDIPSQDFEIDPEARAAELERLLPAVRQALTVLKEESPQHAFDRDLWLRTLTAVRSIGFDHETELALCDNFSKDSPKYVGTEDVARTLSTLSRTGNAHGTITVGSLFWNASRYGFEIPTDYVRHGRSAKEDFGHLPFVATERWDTPVRVPENMLRLEETVDKILIELARYGWPVTPEADVPGLSAVALPLSRRVFVGPTGDLCELVPASLVGETITDDSDPALRIRPIHKDAIAGLVCRVVELQREKISKDGAITLIPTEPKDRLLKHLASMSWPPHIKRIKSIVGSPTMVGGGRVLTAEGYDEQSQILYHGRSSGSFDLAKTENPSQEDARNAAAELIDLLRDYEFAGEFQGAGHAMWLASVLTLVGFHWINDRVPMFAFDAPREAAGKSKLVRLAAIIGHTSPKMASYQNPDELQKSLPLILQHAPRMLQFDNVSPEATFGGPGLESLLTEGEGEFRVITTSKVLRIKMNSVIFTTGNRLRLTQDMRRRTLKLSLLSNSPNPEKRTDFFYRDLTGFAEANRRRFLTNALIILRAWYRHIQTFGLPTSIIQSRISNFPEWCDKIRGAVMFADPGHQAWSDQSQPWVFDPALALVSAGSDGNVSEVEAECTAVCDLVEAIEAEMRQKNSTFHGVRTQDIKRCRADCPIGSPLDEAYTAFDEVVELKAMSIPELGRFMGRLQGRTIADGRQLKCKTVRGMRRWFVVSYDAQENT